jgi:hypothetical protein
VQWTAGFRFSPIPGALAPPPLTRVVMPRNRTTGHVRVSLAVCAAVALAFGVLAVLDKLPRYSGAGVSRFEFVNGFPVHLSQVKIGFYYVIPGGQNPPSGQFVRSFTNVPPFGSVVVRWRTPMLTMYQLDASGRWYDWPAVVATPDHPARLRYTPSGFNRGDDL